VGGYFTAARSSASTAQSRYNRGHDKDDEVKTIWFGFTRFNAPNRTHTEEVVKGTARAIIVELK
jgi:hypothetical protein